MTTFLSLYSIVLTVIICLLVYAINSLKADNERIKNHIKSVSYDLYYHTSHGHDSFKEELIESLKKGVAPAFRYDEELKAKVKADLAAGSTIKEITLKYGIGKNTVARWRKEIKVS